MPRFDVVVAALVLLGSVPAWVAAGRFPGTASLFPRFSLVLLIGAAASVLLRAVLAGGRARGHPPPAPDARQANRRRLGRALASFGVVCGAVEAARGVGFFPAAVALAMALAWVLRIEARRQYAALVTGLLVLVWVVFVLGLGVPLAGWRQGI